MRRIKTLSFIITLFAVTAAFSQNYNDALRLTLPGLGSNARALGMGNAFNALSDDASAMFFNPAGLGLLKRLEFSGGIDYYRFNNNAEFIGTNTEYSNSKTQLNRLSFAFPFPTTRGSLVFGLSYHVTTNLTSALKFDAYNPTNTSLIQDLTDIEQSSGTPGIPYDLYLSDGSTTLMNGRINQNGDILASGDIGNWTFSGAIEAARNFFIGANLNIVTGSYNQSNNYYEEDLRNNYTGRIDPTDSLGSDFQTFNLNRILDWDLSGWDAKVGFLYQMEKIARLGVTIQFPKNFSIKEKFNVSGYSDFGVGGRTELDPEFYSYEAQYDITTPFMFTGAFSVNLAGLIFGAEATLVDYSQIEFSGENQGISAEDLDAANREMKDLLTAVINYNLGLEYTIPVVGLRLRGGFMTNPSAFKNDPSEFDRKYLTAGIGYLTEETVGIDLGYAHGWWNDFGDNYGQNISRTNQDITVDNFIFTLTYRF